MLQNVFFDKEKGKLIATDGKRMAIVTAEAEEGDTSGFVSPEALKEYRRQAKKSAVSLLVNGKQIVGPFSLDRPTQEQVGNFPNWQAVLPTKNDKVTLKIGLNAKLLWELAQALGSEGVVTLELRDDKSAVSVSTANGDGLLMPFKI